MVLLGTLEIILVERIARQRNRKCIQRRLYASSLTSNTDIPDVESQTLLAHLDAPDTHIGGCRVAPVELSADEIGSVEADAVGEGQE